MKILVKDIIWDTDCIDVKKTNLPKTITVEIEEMTEKDEIVLEISKSLSDMFGGYHYGFSYKILEL